MRDILDKINLLLESTGLSGRKSGDTFKNSEDELITFRDIQFTPAKGGKLSSDQLDTALRNLDKKRIKVSWQNNRTAKSGGYAIAIFDTEQGEVYFGFFKDIIKPNKTDNYIPNQIGDFRFAGKSAAKMQSGLTPQDLLIQRNNLTSDAIVEQLTAKLGPKNILVQVAQQVAGGAKFPIKFPAPKDMSFTGFRDYFCEILQPMALQAGRYTGNAGEAAERFMDDGFGDTLISFDAAKNAGLSDSILTQSDGKFIKVSTKGGKGAEASVRNILDSINELQQSPNGAKLAKKHREIISLIQEISNRGQAGAPLYLGVEYGIIDNKDAQQIVELKSLGPINLDKIDTMKISKNLKKLAKQRSTNDPKHVNLYYHLMASVAYAAADKVNSESKFSKAAADILNNGALVQVYTKAKEAGKEWILEGFDTVYPGESIKGIYLSAGKNYFSTGIKGNFTFKIDKGQGKPKEDNEEDDVIEPVTDKKAKVSLSKASKIITRGGAKPISMAPKKSKGVGRTKRKK